MRIKQDRTYLFIATLIVAIIHLAYIIYSIIAKTLDPIYLISFLSMLLLMAGQLELKPKKK